MVRIEARAAQMGNDALIFIRTYAHRHSPNAVVTSPKTVAGMRGAQNGKRKIKQKTPWKRLRQPNEIQEIDLEI